MPYAPTDEQQLAVNGFSTGENIVIEAGAGTGKTSTLQYIAQTVPHRKGLYLAFNKAIQTEAEEKFRGTNVTAKTAHSLAYARFGRPNQEKLAKGMRMRAGDRGDILGLMGTLAVGGGARRIPRHVAIRLVGDTVNAFCRTSALEITPELVPVPDTLMLTEHETADLQRQIAKYAVKYWDDVLNPKGQLPYTHDFYLKQWAMSNPVLEADYILFDEAQDSDPLISSVVLAQTSTQIVAVGDQNQAIYGWRGALNAMDHFGGQRFQLTQSFRFGQEIADEANVWLTQLQADLRLRGTDKPSSVHESRNRIPEAVLCRTNAGAIGEVMNSQRLDVPVAISGKGKADQMRKLAEAAKSLVEQGWTRHPELDMFRSWEEVQEYVEEDDGADLAPLVKLIDQYGPDKLINAIDNCVPEDRARTVIATAHVAKGLEWFHVRIADDFKIPGLDDDGNPEPILESDAMLAYVAVTRAQRHLDPGGLAWIRSYQKMLVRPEIGLEWKKRHVENRKSAADNLIGAL